jgi:hypothetical protein
MKAEGFFVRPLLLQSLSAAVLQEEKCAHNLLPNASCNLAASWEETRQVLATVKQTKFTSQKRHDSEIQQVVESNQRFSYS